MWMSEQVIQLDDGIANWKTVVKPKMCAQIKYNEPKNRNLFEICWAVSFVYIYIEIHGVCILLKVHTHIAHTYAYNFRYVLLDRTAMWVEIE